ncbi:MAG: hypothetical protein KC505_11225 [Myxococcales bacterium]|nr:hypothetical protein [Myxococcales bacterium]
MLLQELKKVKSIQPNNTENNNCIDLYEKQRELFLKQQIGDAENVYKLNDDDKKILIGLFDSAERENTKKGISGFASYRLLPIFKDKPPEEELYEDKPECRAALGWLMIYWSSAWQQFALINKYSLSARFGIGFRNNKEFKPNIYSMAVDDLISDLKEILPNAEKKVGLPLDEYFYIDPKIDKDGILDIDKRKLKWLCQNNIGHHTQKYISEFREFINSKAYDPNKQIEFWERPLSFSREIAHLRWKDRIEKLVDRKQKSSPGLTFQFFNQVNDMTKRGISINKEKTKLVSEEGKIISGIGKTPGTTISIMELITRSMCADLSSITSHYFWRWLFESTHKQHLLDLERPYYFDIIGGYTRLGELCGAGITPLAKQRLKNIISISSACIFDYQGKTGVFSGNLLSYESFEAYGRRPSRLQISLARPLCPGFVEDLPEGNSKYQHQRMIVPWTKMPMLIGRNAAHHAPQSSFQLDLTSQMRLRATEIHERGGILLNDEDMRRVAKGAKLSFKLLDRVLDAWICEEYLEKIDDCIFMLGNRYPEARASLKVAGKLSAQSAEKGRRKKQTKSKILK